MARYTVVVSGCDDSTSVVMDLTDAERDLVVRVAWEITQASEYSCEPEMYVFPEDAETDAAAQLKPAAT